LSKEFTIRRAIPADAPVIASFNAMMALETEHRTLDQKTLRSGVEAVLADSTKGIYYVAEAAGAVIGQLMVTYEWSDWRNGVFWWIQSVYVRHADRGKGVFKALFRHVESESRNRSDVCGLRLYVEGENAGAKKTYEHLSMHKTPYELYEIDYTTKGESKP
jgi:GNAT superfamily N-acetyltransferase